MTYTDSGRKHHVYIDKFNGERKYKQRQYLLWPLRDMWLIGNSNADKEESFGTKFGKDLTFSQLYDFVQLRKEHTFNSNIRHTSCLCEVCEDFSLLAKGLNNRKRISQEKFPTNPYDLVDKFSCNSDEGNCILAKCSLRKPHETIDDTK